MKRILTRLLLLTLPIVWLLVSPAPGLPNGCLRVMTPEELVNEATLIARVKVTRVDRASFGGVYNQLATLRINEVVDGDSTLKDQEVKVWAKSRVACANDAYALGEELLVFLVREVTFYRTLNYQYGKFHVSNEQVLGWRDRERGEIVKTYPEVALQIRAIRTPQANEQGTPAAATPRP